ncbi:Alpha/beta hydrolase fold-1 [Pyrenochaeta sp. MPI-SDFR-AT-0127]|nr:Alpha/beta hydrolase fold-1 [Pyrenochaeta sp. MPI-SDFR-AT-0127]
MSSAAENIVFVLVPPSFSPASFYDRVVPLLEKKGYASLLVELKSVNDGQGLTVSMYEDAGAIRSAIMPLVDQGKGVVLVANSYGGIPATEATKGFSLAERKALSKPGAIIGIVYMASFIASEGGCINQLMVGRMPENTQKLVDYQTMDPRTDAQYIFTHLNQADKDEYASRLMKHCSRTFDDPLTYPGYLHIPATYIICTDDIVLPEDFQSTMISAANAKGADIVTKKIHADHCPMISHPAEVVDVLMQAAEQGVKLLNS